MKKRGVESSVLFLGTLIIGIVIAASLIAYVSNFNRGGYFERIFLSKDLALVISASQTGPGSWDYVYPENLTKLGVSLTLGKQIIKVSKLNSKLTSVSWFGNNSNISWTANYNNGKFTLHRNAFYSKKINISNLWTFGGVVSSFNFTWPVKDPVVTSPFGPRINPLTKKKEFHMGIDIVSRDHQIYTPIYAAADGVVIKTRDFCRGQCKTYALGYGNFVYIDHGIIKGHDVRTFYAHLKNTSLKKGDVVKKGELIGYMGSTGFSTGKHLHFEVEVDGSNVNPINYLPTLKKI